MANKTLFALMFMCSYALSPSTRSTNSYVRKNNKNMQNEPNFRKVKLNVNKEMAREYEKRTLGQSGKNKANSKPNKANSNPIKANLQKAQMNVSKVLTKEYEKMSNWALYENEPKTNPIQTQFQAQKTLWLDLFVCLSFGDFDGLPGPVAQFFPVLKCLYGNFIILHDSVFIVKRLERAHPGRLIVRPVGIIDLEVQDVIGNHGKEQAFKIEPRTAEHSSGLNGPDTFELIDDIGQVFVANGHFIPSGISHLPARRRFYRVRLYLRFMRAMAVAAIASPAPMSPRPSFVFALTLTALKSTPRRLAMQRFI